MYLFRARQARCKSCRSGATLGTASLRRQAIAKRLRPDLRVTPLRGNVETRLRKLDEGEVDATILALAGLKRLGLETHATRIMDADEFLPAVGQGAIGIETRMDDTRVRDMLAKIDHADTSIAVACERAFLAALDGSCKTPIAGHATVSADAVEFRGLIARPDGGAAHDIAGHGHRKDATAIGGDAGRELKHRAGPGFFRLDPMRVVITRPQPAAERTAAALAARGHAVWKVPLMRIERVAADLSGRWGAVIITSANAPGAIAGNAALLKLPLFAVGERSAQAARQAGFANVASAGGDVRDLVQLLRERKADANGALALSRRRRPRRRSYRLNWRRTASRPRCAWSIAPSPRRSRLSWSPRWNPAATCRPCCISPGAAPTITWPGRAPPASPSRLWRCGIIACRRRWRRP